MKKVAVFNPEKKGVEYHDIQAPMGYGFRAFGTTPFCMVQVDHYNRYTQEVNRATYLPDRETLLNRRHAYFVDSEAINRQNGELFYRAQIVCGEDGRGYWVVVKGGEFYRGTVYTTLADAALLTSAEVKRLEALTPEGYRIETREAKTDLAPIRED